jgi:general secretion pathway protein K
VAKLEIGYLGADLAWVDHWPGQRPRCRAVRVRLRCCALRGHEQDGSVRISRYRHEQAAFPEQPKQRGVAIILAMSVVALAAMAATAIMVAHSAWSRQVELARDHAQARALADAGIDWARAVLHDDRRLGAVDHPGEPWALRLPPMPVENGELTGHIEDQQGLFNLNNLVRDGKTDAVQLAAFRRLLALLDLPEELAAALADWLDADDIAQPQGGAEDAHYLALQPPHRAANRALLDIAELAGVRGFTLEARVACAPSSRHCRAPPLNVNSAPPEVLAAAGRAGHRWSQRPGGTTRARLFQG